MNDHSGYGMPGIKVGKKLVPLHSGEGSVQLERDNGAHRVLSIGAIDNDMVLPLV